MDNKIRNILKSYGEYYALSDLNKFDDVAMNREFENLYNLEDATDYIKKIIVEATNEVIKNALAVNQLYPGGLSLMDFLNNTLYKNTTQDELSNTLSNHN